MSKDGHAKDYGKSTRGIVPPPSAHAPKPGIVKRILGGKRK